MLRFRSVFLCVLLALPTAAMAEQKKHNHHSDDDEDQDSSEYLRRDKQFEVVVELLGDAVAPIPSVGVTAGYFLKPDLIAEAAYTQGSASVFFFKVTSQTFELRLKKFWGNSFYANFGAGVRTIGASFDFSSLDLSSSSTSPPTTGTSGDIAATSLTANVGIGNQWQWKNFTMGCDWIGFMAPLAKLSTKDNFPSASADPTDQSDKDSLNRLALDGTVQLLRFYLGASF